MGKARGSYLAGRPQCVAPAVRADYASPVRRRSGSGGNLVRPDDGSRGRRGLGEFATLLSQVPARPAPQGFQPSVALRFGSIKVGARVWSYAAPGFANGVGESGRSDVRRDSAGTRASTVGDSAPARARKYVPAYSRGGFGLPGRGRKDSVRGWEQPRRDS